MKYGLLFQMADGGVTSRTGPRHSDHMTTRQSWSRDPQTRHTTLADASNGF